MFRIVPVLCLLSLFAGCKWFHEDQVFTGRELEVQINRAFGEGSPESRLRVKLLDLEETRQNSYHFLTVDSITANGGKKYYTAILEFDNPILNRFAIYDSAGNLKLLDKSLDGYLSVQNIVSGKSTMVSVTEKFISKDSIKIERTNYYLLKQDTVTKALRIYTVFDDGKLTLRQNVNGFENNRLTATFNANRQNVFAAQMAEYVLDEKTSMFSPKESQFDVLIREQMAKGTRTDSTKLIYNKQSAELSLGITQTIEAEKTPPAATGSGIQFILPTGWAQKDNIFLATNLKKPLKGSLHFNDALGAKIWIAEIPLNSRAEDFVSGYLELIHPVYQNVRASEKILLNRTYYRYFEVTCPARKHIIIFHAAMNLYQRYEGDFEKIINSLTVNCQ